MACESGYYLEKSEALYNTYRTQCKKCPDVYFVEGCVRCSIDACLECESGYVLSDGTCIPCELNTYNSPYFIEPNRCTTCYAGALSECAYCDIGYLQSYSDPASCVLVCDDGQYPLV